MIAGRFYEYAVLNGEENSAQMLMQGPKDLVLDGLCRSKSKTETKSSQVPVPSGIKLLFVTAINILRLLTNRIFGATRHGLTTC